MNISTQVTSSKIGSFDRFTDIGAPKLSGIASYNDTTQTYLLSSSGSVNLLASDRLSFLSKIMNGDFILQTQFRVTTDGHEPHLKTGLMIRSSLEADAPAIFCTVHGDGSTSLQFRIVAGSDMQEIQIAINAPDVLQLEKKGNHYTLSVAYFGEVFQEQPLDYVDLGNDLEAGLFICSHSDEISAAATFTNTKIFAPAPDSLVQYKHYIGSALETMDVATGKRQVLATIPGSFQAPNWTPDAKSLIYNESGKLYNFDIDSCKATVINTDFANDNNNDHVLTFDGTQLGISHHAAESNGESVIYSVPVTGGVPKRITKNSPSYFHGWSPDGGWLVYSGGRNGVYSIYKISKDGGDEIQLTNNNSLDDGPEYSPDGKYIYFCSTRSGKMQLWRMEPDGNNQIQLTFDELNNWFPHVSPDNKWIVFLSFPKEVAADKHPFYERVYIRMMPVGGGAIKVIAYLYGGQGTINVPSWSPNSKQIAFVSNGIF